MTAFAEFLKTTVDESLKKVVQPSGLIPAALFLLLNLGFVYPSVQELGFVTAFSDLDKAWQLAILVALVLVLGYILTSAAGAVLDLVSGDAWRGSLLYAIFGRWHRRKRKRLMERARGVRQSSQPPEVAAWEHASRYAAEGDAPPTAFGNVLKAAQYLVEKRYGIDIVALWPQMEAAAPKDSAALAAAKDQKAGLDLLANLTIVFAAFALEVLVLFTAKSQGKTALFSVAAILAAYVSYRVAVAKARAWGDAVEVVFDLHRDELKTELGLRKTTDATSERELWKEASAAWLGPNPLDEVIDEPKKPKGASYTTSANIKLEKAVDCVVEDPEATQASTEHYRELVRYILLFTPARRASSPILAWAYVNDPRVPSIREEHQPENGPQASASIVSLDEGRDALLWRVGPLAPSEALALHYELPIWDMSVNPPPLTLAIEKRGKSIRIKIRNPTDEPIASATLTYVDSRLLGEKPKLVEGGTEHSASEDLPGIFKWTLATAVPALMAVPEGPAVAANNELLVILSEPKGEA